MIKFYGFSRTADIEIHIIHISCMIITYTLEWLFTLIWLKKKHKKWEHPLSWLVIEDSNST